MSVMNKASDTFLTIAVKTRFEEKLRERLEEVSQEVIDGVVKELQQDLEIVLNRWVDVSQMEHFIKVIVEDKRS